MGSPRSKPGRSRLVADPFDPKIETVEKAVELSIPGVASPGGAGYDFLRQSIANRLAWTTNGLGAHPGLHHWASGPGAAGADRISGRGKSHPEGPVERATEALGRRASHARRDGASIGPQGSRRGGQCGPTRHHPGLVPQARGPQIRWLEGPSKPRQASDQERA